MNWLFRVLGSILVILSLLGVLIIAEESVAPTPSKAAVKPVGDEDSSLKGMKINN